MIDEIIKEIGICLDNGCYMAALTTALTLPDICGKVAYPKDKVSDRYVKWFDDYIGKYECKQSDKDLNLPYFSGKLCYKLRCAIVHEGNPNVNYDKDMDYFELVWRPIVSASYNVWTSESEIVEENGIEKAIHKKYSMDIREICCKICSIAEYYYKNNKEKFVFNYKITNSDFRTKRMFTNPFGLKENK